jgi:hypothetical protein
VVVTTVVEKTAGETSQTAAFVRGTLEATGSVGASMLDIADEGVRGAERPAKLWQPQQYPMWEVWPLMWWSPPAAL